MNKLLFIYVGKTDEASLEQLCNEYVKRLSKFVHIEEIFIPETRKKKASSVDEQKKLEAQQILSKVKDGDYLVLLDENGKERRSVEMADWLGKHLASTYKRLLFVVGGPYGFADEVYAAAQEKCSLSKLTLTHQMVRLFLCEQIYRSFTILQGLPYHHE